MQPFDRMNRISKPQNPINLFQSLSYALPIIPMTMLIVPIAIIQGIYAKYYGLALTTLATIMMISRLFDAFTDPIIGYYSDRYRAKHGTRKPYVVVGSLLMLVSGYYLYAPPGNVTVIYAGFWFCALFTSYTVFEIPHQTWPADIANDSVYKTRLFSYRIFANYCGVTLFYCIPLLPFFDSNEITPQTLKVSFIVVAILTLPCLFQAIRIVPSGKPCLAIDNLGHSSPWGLLRSASKEIVTNKPFLLFMLAFVCSSFAIWMWYGLIFIYVDAYLDMGDQFAEMFLIAVFAGILVTPLWYKLALKLGKKNTWMVAITLVIASFICTGILEPGRTSFAQLLGVKIIQTCGFVCMYAVTPAMLSEIIDYSQWRSSTEKNAIYFSVKVFSEKTSMAAGAALGLAIAGWHGFDVGAIEHTKESIVALKVSIVWIPTLLGIISLIFVGLSPIDERRHRIIRRQLDIRLARAQVKT